MAKLFSQISVIGDASSPGSAPLARVTPVRNAIRRHKWRLRPLKRFVLPLRNGKRQAVSLIRTITPGMKRSPRIERIERSTTRYAGQTGTASATRIYPAEPLTWSPDPLRNGASRRARFSEAAYVFELDNIDFWGRYGGSVLTADNALLGDLSPEVWGIENHPIFSRFRLPEAQHLTGRTAIAVTPEAPGNYYYWLIDLVSRIALIKAAAGGEWDSYTRFLINGTGAPYEAASLAAMGVPLEKILYVNTSDRFQIDHATIPSMDDSSKAIAPWKVRVLRELRDTFSNGVHDSPRRLYISRRSAAVRRVLNEEKLRPLLREAGFKMLELEALPWREQVRLFSHADVILAPHGAALANAAFCRPGTLIAEIAARDSLKCYLRLASSASLPYRLIEGTPETKTDKAFRARENEDLTVDEDAIRDLLREL
jgi:capsular polysaccharide biosynthesis protein